MKIFLLRGNSCPDRVSCPHLFATDRGTHVIQGRVRPNTVCKPGQAIVEIPLTLIPEITSHRHPDLHLTGGGTALVRGARVTDPEVLAAIHLSADESLVEIAANILPTLEVSH